MRTLFIIFLILALLVGAMVVYLAVTTPEKSELVRFPLSESHRALIARVPSSAEAFALVPSPALLHATLLRNPVTRDAVTQWTEEHELPDPWMLGAAPIVAWKGGEDGKTTSYAIRLDGFRALLVRLWLLTSSNADVRWDGSTLIMHDPQPSSATVDLDETSRLSAGLPAGDAFVVQRRSSRGAFPPIGRPSATSIRATVNELVLVSRAVATDSSDAPPIRARFARGAILSAAFAEPPKVLGDLNRLMGTRIDELVDDGGAIALYDVETGSFLPRPRGVISMPADEHGRAQLQGLSGIVSLVGETRDTGRELLVSFDRSSLGLYLKDEFEEATWPANRWSLRIDPPRLVPILRSVGDSAGVRFAAPRIHRAARDLRRWIGALEQARAIEASSSVEGGVEELRVRIAAK